MLVFYSIIIPVYNNEISDIKRCLNSFDQAILQAIFNDIEILVMDDGSKDKCARALDQIVTGYPNANVYHLPHSGAANARNEGIRRAKGMYICFADADDMVTRQFLFDLVKLKKYACDYDVVYGLVHFVKKGTRQKGDDHTDSLELIPIDATGYRELYRHMFDLRSPAFRKNNGYVSRGPVARIVKRELAEKNLFNPNLVLGEDELWNLDLLEATDKLAIVYHGWYLYMENLMSTSRKPNPDFIRQHRDLLVSMLPYMQKHEGSLEGAFANRVFESLHAIINGYYLTPLKKEGFLRSMKEFNKMVARYPYTLITYKYANQGGLKTLIKFALMKAGCLLAVCKMKNMIPHR